MAKNKAKTLDTVELGEWLDIRFSYIPGEVFGRLAKLDEEISCYSSVDLQLEASPHQTCCKCDQPVDCCECGSDANLRPSEPSEFPCMWGTLFAVRSNSFGDWIIANKDTVAECGFFVFSSDLFGVMLGIDGRGYDFLTEHWLPLYNLYMS
jgi:hypothetical protein